MAHHRAPLLSRLAVVTGFTTLANSSRDAKLMCLQRFVRLFAYGSSFLILIQFLATVGSISDAQIGLFLTLTMLGDALISLCLTVVTDKIGRRNVLAFGAASMIFSGAVFAMSSNYWILVFASIVGVISPSGNEIGPFRAVEESILAQLTEKENRSDIFTWYTLFGTVGSALGAVSCGWIIQSLEEKLAWEPVSAYRVIFVIYAIVGAIKLVSILLLSPAVEAQHVTEQYQQVSQEAPEQGDGDEEDEEENVPSTSSTQVEAPLQPNETNSGYFFSLIPYISPASRSILSKLLVLFAIDSFASGMAAPSWITYFFTTVHHLPPSSLGTLFLVTNLLATLSNFAALPLARRFGPLITMSCTHLPSAVFLALIPFPSVTPTGTLLSMLFLSLRSSTSSMDQAPRQAFLSAAVLPSERTAVLGVVNVAKTLAQAGGIGISGPLADAHAWRALLGFAGALKACYDLMMLWMFIGVRDREDEDERARKASEAIPMR
ncbi:hypothetical protein CBS101457_003062 [Exobasidium rhododendri]|nr:hypothetical protein CBS101457_003062 [Exobasidium rhododendri]